MSLEVLGLSTWSGEVTVTFYAKGYDPDPCKGKAVGSTSFHVDETSPVVTDGVLPVGPLHAGSYGYRATFESKTYGLPDHPGECEPFEVLKNDTRTTTEVHDKHHDDVTGGAVPVGSTVHDQATVTELLAPYQPPSGFSPTGKVTFKFFENGKCYGTPKDTEDKALSEYASGVVESTPRTMTQPGAYSYLAIYSGSKDFEGSKGICEPFSVFQPGKTMGFWSNKNGEKRIVENGGYAVNAAILGRGSNIDTKDEATKVLPSPNACGKGTPFIFTVGAQTASKDCTVASGNNANSLNTLASQTLALHYNRMLIPGYDGQTLAMMGCSALATEGLTGSSTVGDAFGAAVEVINLTTSANVQSRMGALNSLLGCLNREA